MCVSVYVHAHKCVHTCICVCGGEGGDKCIEGMNLHVIILMYMYIHISYILFHSAYYCVNNCTSIQVYRIATNFRGLKFSRMSLAQTFRDLIFEDCVRARDVG